VAGAEGMSAEEIELQCEEAMEKAVAFFKDELRGVRTGRASPGLVEHMRIEVASYGSTMSLRELAGINVADGNVIVVKPYDPGTLKDIERGLLNSNLGITPQNDGKLIRLPVPPLSGERREQILSQVKKIAEGQRVAVRNTRREANKQVDAEKKDAALTEDQAEKCKEAVQELTNRYERQIDALLEAKTKEIKEF